VETSVAIDHIQLWGLGSGRVSLGTIKQATDAG
jgi:hypothetical protein